MEKQIITFSANEQKLQKTSGIDCYASNTVAYIEARFDLGDNWSGYDSVRAVWFTDFVGGISTVLDSLGTCVVPYEVLTRKSAVKVNLVGSIADGDVLTDRLTTCPVVALTIKCNAKTDGDNTQPITPSEYEQFVASVKTDADRAEAGATASEQSAQNASESATTSANSATSSAQSATASAQSAQNASESAISAETAKDDAEDARDKILSMRATAETLEAGSDATASYSDGLLTLGIPRGDQGEQGIQGETGATPNLTIGTVETLAPTEDATASITGTAENPVLNLGLPKGDTGEVSLADLEALLPTETASGSIVTITDGQAIVPAKSLKVALEPIQSGSGTPSPDNVRPISGRTEVETIVSPTTSASDGTTYTTTLGRTVYGGTLDVVSGELVVDRAMVDLGSLSWNRQASSGMVDRYMSAGIASTVLRQGITMLDLLSSSFVADNDVVYDRQKDGAMAVLSSTGGLYISASGYTSATAFTEGVSGQTLVYPLATPQTIQLTPQQVQLLLGNNNVWSDGDVTLTYNADIQLWVEKKLS